MGGQHSATLPIRTNTMRRQFASFEESSTRFVKTSSGRIEVRLREGKHKRHIVFPEQTDALVPVADPRSLARASA